MVKSIIPVGKSLGPYIEDGEVKYFDLHLGDEIEQITPEELLAWAVAHNDPTAHFELRFDRNVLLAELDAASETRFRDDIGRDIDRLVSIGALVEADIKNGPLEPFLSKYVLIPTAQSFGNSLETPDKYDIGLNNEKLLNLDAWTQIIWATSYRDGSIWDGCVEFAKHLDEYGPQDVAEVVAKSIPVIVAANCGFVEPK